MMATLGRLCGVDWCDRRHHARGFCLNHYTEWYGNPTSTPGPRLTMLEQVLNGWAGSDQGTHTRCGGKLIGVDAGGHRWAQCDRCNLIGEPV